MGDATGSKKVLFRRNVLIGKFGLSYGEHFASKTFALS